MRVVAVVPIKLDNQRLPGKNIKPLSDGRPLMMHLLETLCEVRGIDAVYVYCSDPSIAPLVQSAGAQFLQRESSLDTPTTKSGEIVSAFGREVVADCYVLAHVTSPFLKKETLERGVNAVVNEGYDSAFTVSDFHGFYWASGAPANYQLDSIPRTQDLAPVHIETCGYYAFTREVLEQNRRIGSHPKLIKVSKIEAIDIDDPEDFEIADAVLAHGLVRRD